jgi:[ribosomal protein S5]-alanine N-acetyltransferase
VSEVPWERFVTKRLGGHRVGADDVEFLVEVFADERVTKTLGGPRDRDRVLEDIDRWNRHWDEYGIGLWILEHRLSSERVGWTMLHHTETGGPGVEVGWTIAADHWRRGFATEAADMALMIGFCELRLEEIVSFTLVDNTASRGVMEKLGLRYDGEVEHAGLPHVLYRLTSDAWRPRYDG